MKCRPQSRGGSFGGIPGDCGPGAGARWTVPTDLRTDRTAASSPGCSGRHTHCQWLLAEDGIIGIQTRGRELARICTLTLANHISTLLHKLLILDQVIFKGLSACKGLFILYNKIFFYQIGLLFSSPWAVIHLATALEVCPEQLLP